jgi:hypothetical protein
MSICQIDVVKLMMDRRMKLEKIIFILAAVMVTSCRTSSKGSDRDATEKASPSECIPAPKGVEFDSNLMKMLDENYSAHSCQRVIEKLERTRGISLAIGGVRNLNIFEHFYFKELKSVIAFQNSISDISPLSKYVNLDHLDLEGNDIRDLGQLKSLVNLTFLSLRNNEILTIEELKGLSKLKHLKISKNLVKNIDPIRGFADLEVLEAESNEIADVTPILGLNKLKELSLSDNPIQLDKCPTSDAPAPLVQFCKLMHNPNPPAQTPWTPR